VPREAFFSKKNGGVDAVRVALDRQRPSGEVGEQHRGDPGVVVDHLALGEPVLGVEHLAQVRQGQFAAVDIDGHPVCVAPS
jgi:hypothetical protein